VNAKCPARRSSYASVEKLMHLALPVRLTHMRNGGAGTLRWPALTTFIRAARACSASAM
jgi:hypothetical protein